MRASQVVGAVRVQDLAVFTNFVEEIVGHVLGERELAVPQQAHLNEEAVPAVHFVESSTGNDVRPRQIQESLLANVQGIVRQLPQLDFLKIPRLHLAAKLLRRARKIGLGYVDRPSPIARRFELWIGRRGGEVPIRSRQLSPSLLDVNEDRGRNRSGAKRQ